MPRRKMAGWPRLMETSGAARLCSTPYTTTTTTSTLGYLAYIKQNPGSELTLKFGNL